VSRSIARWSCGISLWLAALNLGLCTPWRFAVLRVPKLRVPELVPEEIARKSHYKIDQAVPIAKVDDRAACDAIIIDAGIRFGGLPSQMANFLDQARGLWARGALHGKVGGAFTSTATQ
jgi:multimeric flavodoxin WrbA